MSDGPSDRFPAERYRTGRRPPTIGRIVLLAAGADGAAALALMPRGMPGAAATCLLGTPLPSAILVAVCVPKGDPPARRLGDRWR